MVASAHWETEVPSVNAVTVNETIHDFYDFPRPLFELRYPAPGDAALADHVSSLLRARGLDHDAWVPLILAWPQADLPVLQLSVQSHLGPVHHFQLGQAIAALRSEGVLVVGAGSFTHDLRRFRGQGIDAPEADDVAAFSAWIDAALLDGRTSDLLHYRRKAPYAAWRACCFVAGRGEAPQVQLLHSSATYGVLRMDAYALG